MKKFQLLAFLLLGFSLTLKSQDITVLFAYTTQAACAAGGPAEIKKNVENGMRLLNEALDNNGIYSNVVAIPDYVEVEFASIDSEAGVGELLSALQEKQGAFNKIHRFRQQKKADIVCLIFSGYAMGQATLDGEFMVTHYKTFDGSYVFPHEFGHVLGCTHKGGLGGPEGGHYFNAKDGSSKRTISANGGASIPCFSSASPVSFIYDGMQYYNVSVGDSNHDNAGTIRKNWDKKSSLGNNLPYVPEASKALAAKLVNPAFNQSPKCKEESVTIKSCYIDSESQLNIEYDATSEVNFSAELLDINNISAGSFGTSLKPGGSPWSTRGRHVYQTTTGDKYVVTINESKFTCPQGRSTISRRTIITINGSPSLDLAGIKDIKVKAGEGSSTTVSDGDGNSYPTVKTFNKIYLTENLKMLSLGTKSDLWGDGTIYYLYTSQKAIEACKSIGAGWRVMTEDETMKEAPKNGIMISTASTGSESTCSCVKDL